MIKTCALCGKEFEAVGRGSGMVRYCLDCRANADGVRCLRYYRKNKEVILAKRKAKRATASTGKICARCGKSFVRHPNAKYCTDCSREKHIERSSAFFQAMRKPPANPIRHCEVCGKEFLAIKGAKFCPDCRKEAYKRKAREYKRRYDAARRAENPPVKRVAKPKLEVYKKKDRLAYLRKRLESATTHAERRKYFRQYILLKQELMRGAGHD